MTGVSVHSLRGAARPAPANISWARVEFWLRQSLRDLDFRGKSVLDVGAGTGLFSCYIARQGASKVVALEPELAGSGSHPRTILLERVQALRLDNVTCLAETFQDYGGSEGEFDVILAHHVINHLDEDAVVGLHRNEGARGSYRALLGKFYELLKPGGVLVMADCARVNLFAWLGVRNPIAPAIEWHKHQNPELWMTLLHDVGFDPAELHWVYPRRLRALGWLLDHRFMSLLMDSHFVLHVRRPARLSVGPR